MRSQQHIEILIQTCEMAYAIPFLNQLAFTGINFLSEIIIDFNTFRNDLKMESLHNDEHIYIYIYACQRFPKKKSFILQFSTARIY